MGENMKVRNWDKWQTFRKDRGTPPWIKVYRNLMSNEQWVSLTDAEKGQLISIWMLAADKGGVIPDNPIVIQRMAMLENPPNLNKFIELKFLSGKMTTTCQPDGNHMVTSVTHQSREEESRVEQSREETEEIVAMGVESPSSPKKTKHKKEPAKTTATWKAYSLAYHNRYGVDPIRNARVNGQLTNFIKLIPHEEAPHVAAYYVDHNNNFYVQKMHPVGLMLSDAEKLRTEWATNKQMTRRTAQHADDRQSMVNTADEAQKIIDRRNNRE